MQERSKIHHSFADSSSIMLRKTTIVLTLLAVLVPRVRAYCDAYNSDEDLCSSSSSLCPETTAHVDCHDLTMAPACGNNALLYAFPAYNEARKRIIYRVNQIRNTTAGGLTQGYDGFLPKAVRAGYMHWSCQLAFLAMKQVMQCNFEGDECHNTFEHPLSGQLVYFDIGEVGTLSQKQTIENAIGYWASGSAVTDIADIGSFTSHDGNDAFALLVNEQNNVIGCGFINFQLNVTHEANELICNVGLNNVEGCPVYTQGVVARSDCHGYSRSHNNLCDVAENYENACVDVDFCTNAAPIFCPAGITHIACATPVVNSSYVESITFYVQDYFVQLMNSYRETIAGGQAVGAGSTSLPNASAMAELKWSTDLARLAELHAIACSSNKDECHNSHSYIFSGQSIYIATGLSHVTDTELIIDEAIASWYNQGVNIDSSIIANYISSPNYEDFANLAHERNLRVGCAIAISGTDTACVVCNFATQAEDKCPVYNTATTPASGCTTLSTSYYNLCSPDEYKTATTPYAYFTSTCV